jgi:hypothetical protein
VEWVEGLPASPTNCGKIALHSRLGFSSRVLYETAMRLRASFLLSLPVSILLGVSLAAAQDATPLDRSGAGNEGPDVVGAFVTSVRLLLIEHGTRLAFQEKTRRELSGPFWTDYRRSIRVPTNWEDGDDWWVNYVGHPIHGAAAGYIWLDHEPGAPPDIGLNRHYWATRARATAWSAIYSLQFEFGPLSEASVGNVGLRPETTGWVDHVVTPVGAFGWIVAEDALDRFFVKWVESKTKNRVWRASLRLLFNPGRTLSNTASGRLPWAREGRPLSW